MFSSRSIFSFFSPHLTHVNELSKSVLLQFILGFWAFSGNQIGFFFVACMETWHLLSSEERPCSFPDKVSGWMDPDSSRNYRSNEPVKIEIWGSYNINQSEGAVCISIKWLGNVWVLGCSPLQFSPQVWLRILFVTALSNMNSLDLPSSFML